MLTERTRPELYVDIETTPDQRPGALDKILETIQPPGTMSKPETIAKWMAEQRPAAAEEAWRKTALNGGRGHVCVIGYALNDAEPSAVASADPKDERDMLAHFFGELDRMSNTGRFPPRIIGFNVIGFDLRFMFQRAVVLGLKPPHWLPFDAKPWDSDKVLDVMVAWAGQHNFESMDAVCQALGLAGKGDIDGSMVWDYVKAGRLAEVVAYCQDDVRRTRELHYRVEFREPVEVTA